MRSGRVAGGAYIADLLARVDMVSRLYSGRRKVGIPSLDAVAMANGHEVAVRTGRAGRDDCSCRRGRDRRSGLGCEVVAGMLDLLVLNRIDAGAITRGRSSDDRHREARNAIAVSYTHLTL